MGRPLGYQWQPLGLDADPVPGDPQAISAEAQHLASVANKIAGQIAALRKIANDDTEVGQHAETIRSSASSLAGSLQAVATRYTKVSSALTRWAPELEQAQALSIRALNEAEAPYAKLNQASKDSLADHESFWGDIVLAIRSVCTGLEVVATGAAILAFVLVQFVPGLDVIVDTAVLADALVTGAFYVTLAATAGRFVLADTHNGSWLDFGLDAFACLTFGAGRFLGAAAKTPATSAEAASRSAMVTELVVGAGTKAAELARYASMMGNDVGELAERFAPKLAQTAVKLATDDGELTGRWKVLANLGSLSGESEQFARALAITTRFADSMGSINAVTKLALTASGVGAGLTSLTGIGSLIGGGIEIDGPHGPTVINWHIPGVSNWYRAPSRSRPAEADIGDRAQRTGHGRS
jgi:hypothetical protein